MQALTSHRRPLHHQSTTARTPAPPPRCRVLLQSHSTKRRDVLVSTVSLLLAAADAVASEEAGEQAAQSQAAAAAAPAAADGSTTPASTGKLAGAWKAKKKRKKPPPKPKPSLKPPGVVPRVKLADNLSVSKVGWQPQPAAETLTRHGVAATNMGCFAHACSVSCMQVIRGCWQLDGQHR